MSDNVVALPQRGKTYLTGPNRTADSTGTTSKAIEEIRKRFKDLDYSTANTATPRSGGEVWATLVRNSSGRTLLPKMAVVWKAGKIGKEVDRFTNQESGPGTAGIVDEWLPSTGVAANDYFWCVTKGPSLCLKSVDGNTIAHNAWVTAITAAGTTDSTTAGRVTAVAATTESTTTLSHALNRIGIAMSTSNTNGASTNFLVYVDLPS